MAAEKVLCITRLENVLQVLALVGLGRRLCPTNRACTCKMAFSSLVIQIIIFYNRQTNVTFLHRYQVAMFLIFSRVKKTIFFSRVRKCS
jgi:hypothetical protein